MKNSADSYNTLQDHDKKALIQQLYVDNKLSFANIAEKYGTYANKLRRDAIKFGIKPRDKSEAQKNAIEMGIHEHPTKGKTRPEYTKQKIGKSVMKSWDSISDEELEKRKNNSRQRWESMSKDSQKHILKKANEAVRKTSKVGSKLEQHLLQSLIGDGFKVEFHKEQTLLNTKLQIDLFLPQYSIAIEVDGPSHFEPVWGNESLKRNKKYDAKKEGLILGKGWTLIRIKQTKDYSKSRADLIYSKLSNTINQMSSKAITDKIITIKDN